MKPTAEDLRVAREVVKELYVGLGLSVATWEIAQHRIASAIANTCQFPGCGKQENLDTHHIAMRSLRPDLRFDVNNGVTLCRKHHAWVSLVGNRDEAVAMGLLDLTTYEKAMKEKAA